MGKFIKSGQSGRPSREQRRQIAQIRELESSIDKQGRTRGAKKKGKIIRGIVKKDPHALERARILMRQSRPPRRLKDGTRIYSGLGRAFERAFSREWWRTQPVPWMCHICGDEIDEKGDGAQAPSIDHVKPWSEIRTEVPTRLVCCNRVHWEVALTEDYRSAFQDESNLKPAHQGCNSKKNGPKDRDSLGPQKRGVCSEGKNCNLPKAFD